MLDYEAAISELEKVDNIIRDEADEENGTDELYLLSRNVRFTIVWVQVGVVSLAGWTKENRDKDLGDHENELSLLSAMFRFLLSIEMKENANLKEQVEHYLWRWRLEEQK